LQWSGRYAIYCSLILAGNWMAALAKKALVAGWPEELSGFKAMADLSSAIADVRRATRLWPL